MTEIPERAREDLKTLLPELSRRGFELVESSEGSMHQYLLRFTGPRELCVICDRGDLFVDDEGSRVEVSELETAGLWRAFRDSSDFAECLLAWLDASAPPPEN